MCSRVQQAQIARSEFSPVHGDNQVCLTKVNFHGRRDYSDDVWTLIITA